MQDTERRVFRPSWNSLEHSCFYVEPQKLYLSFRNSVNVSPFDFVTF